MGASSDEHFVRVDDVGLIWTLFAVLLACVKLDRIKEKRMKLDRFNHA